MVTLALETSASLADWIAAIGQAVGALFTAAAVWVALRISRRERLDFEKERAELAQREQAVAEEEARGQARLVNIGTPRFTTDGSEASTSRFTVPIVNHGDYPIINVALEVRGYGNEHPLIRGSGMSHIPTGGSPVEVVAPSLPFNSVIAFHILWADHKGRGWARLFYGSGSTLHRMTNIDSQRRLLQALADQEQAPKAWEAS